MNTKTGKNSQVRIDAGGMEFALVRPSSTWFKPLILAFCLIFIVILPLDAAQHPLHYLDGGKPDPIALLAPPPLPDSPEQAADMATVLSVHDACTSNQLAVAFSGANFSVFSFTNSSGAFLQRGKFPKTEAFFRHVQSDTSAVVAKGKVFWKRPRPYVTDPRLAIGPMDHEFSYPSGHSTGATAMALVLAEIFPDQIDTIMAQSRVVGWHRIEIGRHYPTDVYAGRVLAQAIVREMKANAAFQNDLAQARAELAQAEVSLKNEGN